MRLEKLKPLTHKQLARIFKTLHTKSYYFNGVCRAFSIVFKDDHTNCYYSDYFKHIFYKDAIKYTLTKGYFMGLTFSKIEQDRRMYAVLLFNELLKEDYKWDWHRRHVTD